MKSISVDALHETLYKYEMELRENGNEMMRCGNKRKAELYYSKANAVRACIKLSRKI